MMMAKKTTTKDAQPDLLGAAAPAQPAAKPKPIAKAEPHKKPASKEVAIAAPPQAKSMLQVIAEAATNPACDVGKMQALLDMQEKMEAKQARQEFITDFIALQAELPFIAQDGKIKIVAKDSSGQRPASGGRVQQSTPYATFNNIMKAVKPLLNKHHFSLSFATEPSLNGERIIVKGILDHVSTHERMTAFPLPAETSGSKNNVQGWGSSMSYGKRYCTIALLNIVSHASEDVDRDGAEPPETQTRTASRGAPKEIDGDVVREDDAGKITTKQHDELVDAIEASGAKRATFCEAYSIAKVADLPAELYAKAMKACRDRQARGSK